MRRSAPRVIRMTTSLLLCLPVICVTAQEQPRLPEFEVATVKPVNPNAQLVTGISVSPGGHVLISAATLTSLVASAFGLAPWQVAGGDSWTRSERFTIEAKPSAEMLRRVTTLRSTWTDIEDQTLRAMLQALLRDRFQLRFHRATKMGDVYVLEQSGTTLRLRPSASPQPEAADRATNIGSLGYAVGRWVMANMSMAQLAQFASNYYLHAPVVDRTGLEGTFDYRQVERDIDPKYDDTADSFRRLIPDLGLRLVRIDGPVETVVIDSAHRPPPN